MQAQTWLHQGLAVLPEEMRTSFTSVRSADRKPTAEISSSAFSRHRNSRNGRIVCMSGISKYFKFFGLEHMASLRFLNEEVPAPTTRDAEAGRRVMCLDVTGFRERSGRELT